MALLPEFSSSTGPFELITKSIGNGRFLLGVSEVAWKLSAPTAFLYSFAAAQWGGLSSSLRIGLQEATTCAPLRRWSRILSDAFAGTLLSLYGESLKKVHEQW